MSADKELFLVAQLDPADDDPDRDALYDLGVIATAMQLLKLPDGTVRVLVEGVKRARLVGLVPGEGFMSAEVEEVDEETADGPEIQALMRSVVGPQVGVKAAGGIRSLADAQAMVAAGATRLGCSAGVQIVREALGGPAAPQAGQQGY